MKAKSSNYQIPKANRHEILVHHLSNPESDDWTKVAELAGAHLVRALTPELQRLYPSVQFLVMVLHKGNLDRLESYL